MIFQDSDDFGFKINVHCFREDRGTDVQNRELLYESGNLPDFQLRSGKVTILIGVRAATRLLDVLAPKS